MRLRPDGVGIHFTRAFIPDRIANDTLAGQLGLLAEASATLLPDGSLDVVCYACTSGSIVMGEERVHAELKRGNPNAKPTSLSPASSRRCGRSARSPSPSRRPISTRSTGSKRDYLEAAGFDVVNIEGLNVERDSDMVRITPNTLRNSHRPSTANRPIACSSAAAPCVRSASSPSSRQARQAGGRQQSGDDLGYLAHGRDPRSGRGLRHAAEQALSMADDIRIREA